MMVGVVSCALADGVGTITLDNPPANALGRAVIDGLRHALTKCVSASVVVIRSSLPRFFVAGADLTLLGELDTAGFATYLNDLRSVLEEIASAPFLSIAAIDGMALGGGLELAMACTLRVASVDASLGLPEVKLGLLPGAGGTQRLVRFIGRGPAFDLLLSGRSMSGRDAHAARLVERVAEPGATASAVAAGWASELAMVPRSTAAAIRRCVNAVADDSSIGMTMELDEVVALFGSPVGQEGVAAFVEKRPPRFPS